MPRRELLLPPSCTQHWLLPMWMGGLAWDVARCDEHLQLSCAQLMPSEGSADRQGAQACRCLCKLHHRPYPQVTQSVQACLALPFCCHAVHAFCTTLCWILASLGLMRTCRVGARPLVSGGHPHPLQMVTPPAALSATTPPAPKPTPRPTASLRRFSSSTSRETWSSMKPACTSLLGSNGSTTGLPPAPACAYGCRGATHARWGGFASTLSCS